MVVFNKVSCMKSYILHQIMSNEDIFFSSFLFKICYIDMSDNSICISLFLYMEGLYDWRLSINLEYRTWPHLMHYFCSVKINDHVRFDKKTVLAKKEASYLVIWHILLTEERRSNAFIT